MWVFNEDELGSDFDENDKILGEENDIIKNNEEKGIELLCWYLKNSVITDQKWKIKQKRIINFFIGVKIH